MRRIRKVFSEEMYKTFEGDNSLSEKTQDEVIAHIYSKDHGATTKGEGIICNDLYCEDCRFWEEEDCLSAMYDWLMEEI